MQMDGILTIHRNGVNPVCLTGALFLRGRSYDRLNFDHLEISEHIVIRISDGAQ